MPVSFTVVTGITVKKNKNMCNNRWRSPFIVYCYYCFSSITVSPAGSVITSPMVVTEEHGQNVSLHCDSQGGPNNMYFWVRNASEEVCLDCAGVVDFKTFLEGN